MICPNINIKEVKDGFNEIVVALGGKPLTDEEFRSSELRNQRQGIDFAAMEATYRAFHRNNGNMLDLAPNGKHSVLFESLLNHYNGDRDKAIAAKSRVYSDEFFNWFGNWTAKEKENVSKVVDENGEPLVVYHHTDNPNLTEFSTDFDNYFSKDGGTKEAIFFDENETGTLNRKYDIPVFLNIKDLHEYNETKEQLHQRGTTYRQVVNESAAANNIDGGVHMKDFDDNKMDHQNIWIVHNPNQIKSATDNEELFSTENNDIYLHTDKRVKGTGNLLDEIPREGATSIQVVENVVKFLKNKFPTLNINVVDDIADIHREDPNQENILKGLLYSNRNVKSLVYHGDVYLVRSRLSEQGGQIASEEILHMLVKTLQDHNPDLFKSLLRESRSKFKKLTRQIEDIYKNSSQDTIDNEIVTQSLARYVNRDIQANKNSRFAELVDKFVEWLKSILINSSDRIGNTVYINPTQLKSLTLQELSDLINAEDTAFDIYTEHDGILYHMDDNSIVLQMYDINNQIEEERIQYIDSVVSQYKISNPDASELNISVVRNKAREQFNIEKSDQLLKQHQIRLADVFGLTLNTNGYYESQQPSQKKILLEHIVNSLQQDTFALYRVNNIGKTKYQQVGAVKNGSSVANLLYKCLYDGDIITLDKELARDYLRIFWGSDLIQSALDSLNDGRKTSEQLENELVDKMTKDPVDQRDTSIIEWFKNIWNSLADIVKQVFNPHNFTEQQKEDILKAVDAAFMLSYDLEYTYTDRRIYDRADGNFDSSTMLSEKDKKALSSIRSSTVTRIKSQQSRMYKNQKIILDLKQRLESIDAKNEDSIDDIYDVIQDFLITAEQEIYKTRLYIDQNLLGRNYNMENWDPQQINFIQQDLIGYYDSILSIISDLFSDKLSVINKYDKIRSEQDPNTISIFSYTQQLKNDINNLKDSYNKDIVLRYVKKLCRDYVMEEDSIKEKDLFVYNMNKWIEQDSAYGDLAFGEVLIGMASRSKSPVVRIVEKFASEADFETGREVLKKGNELIRLYNKIRPTGSQISPFNWQKRFMEFDRNGIPTGYFIRDINIGQFYKDKDDKEQELRIKYNLQADDDGNTIFPEEDFTKDDSTYNKYYDELDTWLSEKCERRYTLDYYKAKRKFLSPKTLQTQSSLQRQIDLIIDKARDKNGFVDIRNLTEFERSQLELLRKKKRDLGSHYIFTEVAGGVLKVEEKQGDALKIADEIYKWNKFISDKVKYKPNWDAFNEAKQNLINDGASKEEILNFERANTTNKITDDFYDLLGRVVGKGVTNPEIEYLKRRYSEILTAIKGRHQAGSQNLNRLGLGLNTDMSGWKELHRIEQRIADIRSQLISEGYNKESGDNSQFTFNDIAATMYVTVGEDNSTTYLEHLIKMWKSAAASNTDLNQVFNDVFMIKDERGRYKYLKAFTYLSPKQYTLEVDGKTISCIQSVPGSEYSELDESSPYVNKKFVKNGPSMQPNDQYKNEAYSKLTSDEILFLDKLKETMKEAYGMIPNQSSSIEDMLPQISGRTASVLSNTIRAKEWSTALKYPFRDFGISYAETDADVSTNADLARRPDGTVVNNIPIRFIRKLKDPSVQSTDVLGSVILFYDMACNYKNKSKNLPTLELIKYAIQPGVINISNSMQQQYKKVENILDQRYYGKETSFGFDSNEKITNAKQRTIQATKTVRNWASIAMLGINFTTIEVGYIDAMLSMLADSVGGKYITGRDYRHALWEVIKHLPKMINGLGNPVVDDKLVAAMQYNQISKSNSEIFAMSDKYKLDKFFKQYCLMGGYTLTDYIINSMFLLSTYNHYKLMLNPKTGKNKFYSKSDAIDEFTKLGYTEKDAIKMWEKSKTTLWDAYSLQDGLFILKDEYSDIVSKKLENKIGGRVRDRSSMYNGIIPQSEKAKMQQNVFGSFITLMRNFYVNTYWDRFKTGGDYIQPEDDHHITWTSEYKRDDIGLVNLETGEFEGAVFKDFCRGMYKLTSNLKHIVRGSEYNKLTAEQKYAVSRSITELGIIAGLMLLMMWSVAFARANDYDEDKDPVWRLNLIGDGPLLETNFKNADDKFTDFLRWKLALLSTRAFTERLTSWWLPTVKEIISNPTTAYSYLEDIGVIWGLATDLFSQRANEEIKTGGYKHMTRGTRDILKLLSPLGFDNLVRQWHTEGIKSTFNFYRQMAPTNAIIPTQTEYNEKNKDKKHNTTNKKNKSKKKFKMGI